MENEVTTPTMKIDRRVWWMPQIRIEHIWLSIPILLVACFGFLLKLRLVDFWWHLKAGEIITTTRSLPRTDLFSFTSAGKQFILQNWLVEVIYYLVYRAGGLALIVFLNALLLVLALLPIYHLCRESAGPRLRLGVVAALFPAVSLVYFGSVRSQVFSLVLFGVFYWILSGYRRQRRDLLWVLPVGMVLWVNLHGAFVLGLGLFAIVLFSESIRRLLEGPVPWLLSARELGKLALIFVLSALGTLANPETYKLFTNARAIAGTAYARSQVLEWQVPRVDDLEGILLFYGPFFFTLIVLLYSKYRPDLTEFALFLAFAVLALMAVRNAVWFVLISAPILARSLPDLDWQVAASSLRRFRPFEALARWVAKRKETQAPIRYALNRQIVALLLTITILVTPWIYPHLGNKYFGDTLWEKDTPVAAMDYIQEHGLKGNIFHPQIYGDYLIWRLWPEQRSFIDGRVHLFDDSVIQDYRLVFRDSHWDEHLAKYDIKYLLLSKDDEENRMMLEAATGSSTWRTIYDDPKSILFERAK